MIPHIQEDLLSVGLAVFASFIFGWVWHGPLFGKLCVRLMKLPDIKPTMRMMMRSMALELLATFLTAHVLVYTTNVWRPSVWGIGVDRDWFCYGFMSGFYTWLGFYVPMVLSSVAWEKRSGKLAAFNLIYRFLDLQILAMIIAYMYAH